MVFALYTLLYYTLKAHLRPVIMNYMTTRAQTFVFFIFLYIFAFAKK